MRALEASLKYDSRATQKYESMGMSRSDGGLSFLVARLSFVVLTLLLTLLVAAPFLSPFLWQAAAMGVGRPMSGGSSYAGSSIAGSLEWMV
jgi:hypothetical protein